MQYLPLSTLYFDLCWILRAMGIHWRDWSSDTPRVNLGFEKLTQLTQLTQYSTILEMGQMEGKIKSERICDRMVLY